VSVVRLDHLAVACGALAEGVAAVEAALGVPLAPGGVHPTMGTHNRLLSLGPDEYLEVIAIDPGAVPPGRARWFDLDRFSGPPRLGSWICRTEDLAQAQALAPPGTGVPIPLQRGDFRWTMAVPDDGILPFDGVFPALIAWVGTAHPAPRLPDQGVRLRGLEVAHPRPEALRTALTHLMSDPRVTVVQGAAGLRATFSTPIGERQI